MIAVSAQGATRLMEALEKLGEWAGSGVGASPSGKPDAAVVQAFEEALNAPQTAEAPAAAMPEESLLPGPAETMPSLSSSAGESAGMERVQGTESADFLSFPSSDLPPVTEAASGDALQGDTLQELTRLLNDISRPGAVISPAMLYRSQYLAGMLKMQLQAGMKSSQNVSQGMENMLRQQG